MNIEELLKTPVFEFDRFKKRDVITGLLNDLTRNHVNACQPYGHILKAMQYQYEIDHQIEDIPFLPVRLFKDYEIKSISDDEVIKTLTSSGTTSQKVSKIFLDKQTSAYQTKALVAIIQQYLGKKRLPMLIVDHENVISDRRLFSARGAGILGLANFGRDHTYLLDENMDIDFNKLDAFIEKYRGEKIFIFGFTFMIWQYLYKQLDRLGKKINLDEAVLVHSGGWKKLQDQSVDNETFKRLLKSQAGIKHIYNFYGMVEQVGSIFMECEAGYLHAPVFSDVIIRNPVDWAVLPAGESGVIEVISVLPHSYPGHVLLTEDIGVLHGEDDCSCGRKGKYFTVSGRVPRAEVRGCSDTHAQDAAEAV
ncbi:MAG: acyl-protein synthetase [Gammaproteobacteria bacterium]|nr:acyl-protein synthetase [Gammaproteobacteria bacterium]